MKWKNFSTCSVLLVLWTSTAVAQFIGQQQQQSHFLQRNQLSPQQQGHILSDVQQHQHRFNLNGPQFPPQQFLNNFNNNHQQQQQNNFNQVQFPGQLNQNQQQQQFLQNQQLLLQNQQNQFLNPQLQQSSIVVPTNSPILSTIPTIQQNVGPTIQSNRILQHHTQTSFTPNFVQPQPSPPNPEELATPQPTANPSQVNNPFQPRPTIDPIQAIEQQIQTLDPEKHKLRIKELKDKQAIIVKHNQFVDKQYDKALKKAQSDHQDFIEQQKELKKKLYQRVYNKPGGEHLRYSQSIPRYIYPEEAPLFKEAVDQYYKEHPTTTTTTTTTTTVPPPTTTTERKSSRKLGKLAFLPTALPTSQSKVKTIQTLEDLDQLQKQYKTQQIGKDDLLTQLRLAIGGNSEEGIAKNLSSREISLANGQKVQLIEANDPKLLENGQPEEITLPNGEKVQVIKANDPSLLGKLKTSDPNLVASASSSSSSSLKTQEITLPNGERVEIIKTTDPKLVPGATPLEPGSDLEKLVLARTTTHRPPKAIFDQLTKSVIPPGTNFELLKTGASGGLEQIANIPQNLPNQKKVTFVLLEEQDDGTLKVQGVKGNGKDKPEVDVDSIIKRIKDGEIKLPQSVRNKLKTTAAPVTVKPSSSTSGNNVVGGITVVPNSFASAEDAASVPILKTNIGTHFVATSTPSSTVYTKIFTGSTVVKPTTPTPNRFLSTTISSKSSRKPHILNHPVNNNNDLVRQASTSSSSSQNSIYVHNGNYQSSSTKSNKQPQPTSPSYSSTSVEYFPSVSSTLPTTPHYLHQPTVNNVEINQKNDYADLPEVLKKNGLFAMAKFLRQSGLDTILNETGPYTIFVPTDKAFRTLLVQLGGPEKAEEKFKENPRLLSGLLLHHVIPGAFTISTLQDEMTGVSLAGTQLRVNQYNMHDLEWNDVKITTINGAKVLDEKKDIDIPQGIAHSVDRVMFPLPVGDIVQTLQSDRERRFTNFLRAIFSSGLAETLQGSKTFTLFAPTDKAFALLSSEDLARTVTDRTLARELIFRHLVAGTLYTNGMRYYQIKDSLLPDRQITLSKQSGKVKVNNVQLATQNIPATNGVIHAIDSLL